jgi:hypothetical protein
MNGGRDPEEMTAQERQRELSEILARGFLRMLEKGPIPEGRAFENNASSYISNGCSIEQSSERA